jgi:hypothetical protein
MSLAVADGGGFRRWRLRGKQLKPDNYPTVPPLYSPMQDCRLGAELFFDYLTKSFLLNGRGVKNGLVEEMCVILSRIRRCCKAMGSFVEPALSHSGIFGVCYLRYKHDIGRPGFWPQTSWLSLHRSNPVSARQLALLWNADGNVRPPSPIEIAINKRSLPSGFVVIDPNTEAMLSLTDEEFDGHYKPRKKKRRRLSRAQLMRERFEREFERHCET